MGDQTEDWLEDEAAYAEYKRTGLAIPIEAVEAWVRSWGSANELPKPTPQ
jgi:predicted transcriptional regulator